MKVKITVNKEHGGNLILFGTRNVLHQINYGNETGIKLEKIEFDEDYKKQIGLPSYHQVEGHWYYEHSQFLSFLMDCVKYDFRVTSINGEPLKRRVKSDVPVTFGKEPEPKYEIIEELNPYLEIYEYELPTAGQYELIVELKKL